VYELFYHFRVCHPEFISRSVATKQHRNPEINSGWQFKWF